jgi:hypothetical protein
MNRIWSLAGVALLAALGLAVGAYAHPGRWHPPAPPTTTTTVATTTVATTTVDATTTTVDATTTTVDATTTAAATGTPAAPTARITSPANGSFYTRGSTALAAGRVSTPADGSVSCTVDWGDQTAPSGPAPAREVAPGSYVCPTVGHVYLRSGYPRITLAATLDGAPVGADSVVVSVY